MRNKQLVFRVLTIPPLARGWPDGGSIASLTFRPESKVVGPMSLAVSLAAPESPSLGQDMIPLDSDVIEVALLLPRWQALALQSFAKQRGMSAAQVIRRIVSGTVGTEPLAASR